MKKSLLITGFLIFLIIGLTLGVASASKRDYFSGTTASKRSYDSDAPTSKRDYFSNTTASKRSYGLNRCSYRASLNPNSPCWDGTSGCTSRRTSFPNHPCYKKEITKITLLEKMTSWFSKNK